MLLANECVARELRLAKQPTVYRIHETPDSRQARRVSRDRRRYGSRRRPHAARQSREAARRHARPEFRKRAQDRAAEESQRASYAPDPLGHYGLAKPDYTHFTSPIRRYADLIVHRSLERRLGLTKSGPSSKDLARPPSTSPTPNASPPTRERESTRLKKLEFFQRQIATRAGRAFPARILEARNYGLLVELRSFCSPGSSMSSALDDDFYSTMPREGDSSAARRAASSRRAGDRGDRRSRGHAQAAGRFQDRLRGCPAACSLPAALCGDAPRSRPVPASPPCFRAASRTFQTVSKPYEPGLFSRK